MVRESIFPSFLHSTESTLISADVHGEDSTFYTIKADPCSAALCFIYLRGIQRTQALRLSGSCCHGRRARILCGFIHINIIIINSLQKH